MDVSARTHAQTHWNRIACGELPGDKESIEYFRSVEEDRYDQQYWMHDYFRFADFEGKRVLEIGVGQGTHLAQFAEAGALCHGVDITDNHLLLTEKNFRVRSKNVSLHKADATRLPFPDGHFDCVYSFGVLHHIPEIDAVLAEVGRVLKPGGQLMLALYYKWSAFHIFCKILAQGLRSGWLFTKGYASILATIEAGADGVNVKPYVKLYTKAGVRRLLTNFEIDDVSIHQLREDHFWPRPLGQLLQGVMKRLEPRMGWYVACKARRL